MECPTLTVMIELRNFRQVLAEYAASAAELYRDKLREAGKVASGDLISSVRCEVLDAQGGGYEVVMDLASYWKFVEGGSKGMVSSPAGAVYPAHFPPVGALMRWIEIKPVIPRPLGNGKLPTTRQLAYLIGRKILTRGIEPQPALAETLDELNERYAARLTSALTLDVTEYLNDTLLRRD